MGDQLELSVAMNNPLFFDQTVVLGRGNELVLFTVVSWLQNVPDLSAYATYLAIGEPYCSGTGLCGYPAVLSPLFVTLGADSAHLLSGETKLVGDLAVSLQAIARNTSGQCDPPASFRYGGFTMRP